MINTPGQINSNTERGKILIKTINQKNYETIVEIGCWNGLGSTSCILENIKEDTKFFSLESNPNFYKIAKKNLLNFLDKFTLLNGSIVTKDEVENYTSDMQLEEPRKTWLKEDLENLDMCEFVLEKLPKKIDLLILDGGEFSTYLEWQKLKDITNTVILDDIREIKTKKIFDELKIDDTYQMIEYSHEGNGFAIFEKK
jgi:hypothetical protein